MKKYSEGIDSQTGEYFHRDAPPKKPRPPEFVLDFENAQTQLETLVSPAWLERIIQMIHHMTRLRELGVLPDKWQIRIKKQITLKAISAMAKFRKGLDTP